MLHELYQDNGIRKTEEPMEELNEENNKIFKIVRDL